MLRPNGIQRLIQHVDQGKQPVRVLVGDEPGNNRRILLRVEEAVNEMVGKIADILLERLDVRLAQLLGEPPAQRFERPDIANASLFFQDAVHLAQHGERLRVVDSEFRAAVR